MGTLKQAPANLEKRVQELDEQRMALQAQMDSLSKKNQELQQKIQQQDHLIEGIFSIHRALLDHPRHNELLSDIMILVRKILKTEGSSILLLTDDGKELYFEVAQGDKGGEVKNFSLKVDQGIAGFVARNSQPLIENDPYSNPSFNPEFDQKTKHVTRNILCVPLRYHKKTIGVLQVINSIGHDQFDQKDLEMLELFCSQVSLALMKFRMIEELQDKNVELEESSQLKSFFLATISHELRTPLTPIVAWSTMLKDCVEERDVLIEGIEEIEIQSNHLTGIVTNLVHLAEIDCDQVYLNLEELSLNEITKTCLLLATKSVKLKGLKVDSEGIEENLGVRADEEKLQLCISQILENAIKFNDPQGWIVFKGWRYEESVFLQCINSGDGIPESLLPILTERFRQVDESRTRKHGGLGVGLSLVQGFMDLFGAKLEITSSVENRETSVTLSFPSL
ncbi:GAF domain-containing sensor histidine kinase [bacterium]|jgi:signal transduction histidine kinase|nr:GAF domain-containing sensor histidine kinase [bacterium]